MSDEIPTEDLGPLTKADPDRRAFANLDSDARPKPGTPGWNAYARLFNAIGEVQGGAQRVAFSTRHYIADHLFKLGYGHPIEGFPPSSDVVQFVVQDGKVGLHCLLCGEDLPGEVQHLNEAIVAWRVHRESKAVSG